MGIAVRAVVIAAIGLALGELESGVAVILTYYAALFLLGIPFLLGLYKGAVYGGSIPAILIATPGTGSRKVASRSPSRQPSTAVRRSAPA